MQQRSTVVVVQGWRWRIFQDVGLLFVLTQTISLIRLADLSNICGVRAGSRCLEA